MPLLGKSERTIANNFPRSRARILRVFEVLERRFEVVSSEQEINHLVQTHLGLAYICQA